MTEHEFTFTNERGVEIVLSLFRETNRTTIKMKARGEVAEWIITPMEEAELAKFLRNSATPATNAQQDEAIREVCRQRCAAYGDPPCWQVAPENWHCDNTAEAPGPGCREIVGIVTRSLEALKTIRQTLADSPSRSQGETYAGRAAREFKEGSQG